MSDQLSNDLQSLRIDRSADAPQRARGGGIMRGFIWLLVIGAAAGGGLLSWPYLEARLFKTTVATTEIMSISPAQASTSLTATGYVVARTLSKVSAKITGRVSRVHVREGQTVRAGDVVVELDVADQASAIATARAKVALANARVAAERAKTAEVEVQLTRARALATSGAGTRGAVDDLEARFVAIRAAIAAAQADVRAAQAEVHALEVGEESFTVRAPIDGTVLTKPVEVGEMVDPSAPMFELGDFNSLVMEVDVPETRLSLVRIDAPCEIILEAFPGKRYRGAVQEIGRRINRSKATVPVRVRFVDPMTDVLPEMSGRVSFLTSALTAEQLRAAERTVVPAAAVTQRGGRDVVFEIVDGKARMRAVRLGASTSDGRELLDGPAPGTKLVANPPPTLAEGQSVKERTES